MDNHTKQLSKKRFKKSWTLKRIALTGLVSLLLLVTLLFGAFLIYASDYYRADPEALAVLDRPEGVVVSKNFTLLRAIPPSDIGIIFYPGGKVESTAYLPMLDQLSRQGIHVILVDMPFNFAFLDSNAANRAFELVPEVKYWYISGHSLGGAMASNYASKNPEKVEGLILLGAYIYGDFPPSRTLTVYGTFNDNLEKFINYTENVVIIDGGNHAQFGNYGKQAGDPDATISALEQQQQAIDAILNFVGRIGAGQ